MVIENFLEKKKLGQPYPRKIWCLLN